MSRSFFHLSNTPPDPKQIGTLGEQLVGQWLCQQGWEILQHQYHTRWGEIDLIAMNSARSEGVTESTLIFVEVKTRSRRNWDGDGLLAIAKTKQEKLIQSAQWFLTESPELANHFCRFDIALVRYDQLGRLNHQQRLQHQAQSDPTPLGQPINQVGCRLTLQQYIESAFWLT